MSTRKDSVYTQLLAVRYQRGDRHALDEIIRLWEHRLYYFLRRLLSNEQDSWDCLQEVWIRVAIGLPGLRDTAKVVPWIYSVARNGAMAALRGRYAVSANEQPWDESAEEIQQEPEFQDAAVVHAGLDKLSHHHREALTLFFLRDLSLAEIAEVTEASLGTVKSRIYYAKRELRTILEREGVTR